MRLLTWTLFGTTMWCVIFGLWDHSWQLITAGVATAVIWPLVSGDVVGDESRGGSGPEDA